MKDEQNNLVADVAISVGSDQLVQFLETIDQHLQHGDPTLHLSGELEFVNAYAGSAVLKMLQNLSAIDDIDSVKSEIAEMSAGILKQVGCGDDGGVQVRSLSATLDCDAASVDEAIYGGLEDDTLESDATCNPVGQTIH